MALLFFNADIFSPTGFWILVAGLLIRYQIGRRRFNRRSVTGVQLYSSYLKAVLIMTLETLFNWLGALCIVIGIADIILHL